jgi:hypothetical protein
VIIDVTLPAAVRITTSDTTLSKVIFSIVPGNRFRMLVLIYYFVPIAFLVSPSIVPNELDADINQPREEIPVDDESAPFCVVVGGWFGSYNFL